MRQHCRVTSTRAPAGSFGTFSFSFSFSFPSSSSSSLASWASPPSSHGASRFTSACSAWLRALVFTAQSSSAPSALTSIATTRRSRAERATRAASSPSRRDEMKAFAHAKRDASFSLVLSRLTRAIAAGKAARLSRTPRRIANSAQWFASCRGRRASASSEIEDSEIEVEDSSEVEDWARFVFASSRVCVFASGTTRATFPAATLTMARSSSVSALVVRMRLRAHLCGETSALAAASRTPSTSRATGLSQGLASAADDANQTTFSQPPSSVGTSATRNATSCGGASPRPSAVSSSSAAASARSARVGSYGRISALRALRDMPKCGDGRGASPFGASPENARGGLGRWRAARSRGWRRRAGRASVGDASQLSAGAPAPRRMPRRGARAFDVGALEVTTKVTHDTRKILLRP